MPSSFFSDSSNVPNRGSFNLHIAYGRGFAWLQYAVDDVGGQRVAAEGRAHLHTLHHGARGGKHLLRNTDTLSARQFGSRGLLHAQKDAVGTLTRRSFFMNS